MEIVYKKISELKPWDRNPQLHNEVAISKSIERFGFRAPIIIQKGTGRIISGHGRIKALKMIGKEEVPCIEWDVTDENEMKAYTILDNSLTIFPGMDEDILGELVRELDNEMEDFNLDILGFEGDKLKELLGKIEIEIFEPEYDENMETENECPKCGFKW